VLFAAWFCLDVAEADYGSTLETWQSPLQVAIFLLVILFSLKKAEST